MNAEKITPEKLLSILQAQEKAANERANKANLQIASEKKEVPKVVISKEFDVL